MSSLPTILTVQRKVNEKKLRKSVKPFDFSKHTRKEIRDLIQTMRQTMKAAGGVGLSANQIGLSVSVFVAEFNDKFYAIFNPKIVKESEESETMEEGCLSVPKTFGSVPRKKSITIVGENAQGKPIKIRARDFLARIFQHEIDHLNGKLFLDRADQTFPVIPQDIS